MTLRLGAAAGTASANPTTNAVRQTAPKGRDVTGHLHAEKTVIDSIAPVIIHSPYSPRCTSAIAMPLSPATAYSK